MPNENVLILIPTEFERGFVTEPLSSLGARIELCGFGPVAAASRSTALIAESRPTKVLLLGIAGSLRRDAVVGQAFEFSTVACYGVGVGAGEHFRTAGDMGWQHWSGENPIGDLLPTNAECTTTGESRLLVSSCAASRNSDEALLRTRTWEDAFAEDMEGFSVAVACRLSSTPLTIIRGISNVAGDRDHSAWQVQPAMESAVRLATERLAG